ncbi:MAG: HPr(Ser) kinase/phosphatase [Ignavibacteria bacterium RBG_16_34_14]|nr:MAG: HPr(Ser) kinase/phosphatase [Ignavibacteria bacterium RBG_16_34_14]
MIKIDQKAISRKEFITVEFLYENSKDLAKLNLYSDTSGFNRKIYEQNLHRPGLALAGFVDLFSFSRVQVFGNTEMKYLAQLSNEKRVEAIERIFRFSIPCIILTDNNKPFPELLELSNKNNIPLFGSSLSTTKLVYFVSDFLDDQFAERISIHGSFVDVYGAGILFIGKSGIGKSEVALDLVERGHRLVADDLIILTKKGEGILMGSGTNLAKHFMEIRGLGIIDIERMFGIRAIRYQKRLEIIVELELWDDETEYTRTGLDEETVNVVGVDILYVKLPILPGKNITVISEVISLNYLLKHYGYSAAEIFQDKLTKTINNKNNIDLRGVDYFEHDFE